jgi:hypothetical protein
MEIVVKQIQDLKLVVEAYQQTQQRKHDMVHILKHGMEQRGHQLFLGRIMLQNVDSLVIQTIIDQIMPVYEMIDLLNFMMEQHW